MRTKNAVYNVITGIIPQVIIGILGFIKIRVFINTLGVELNGLMQLFAQIFAYLALAEGGIGSAIQFRLYKLLANKEYSKINSLLKGSKDVFKKIACFIIIIALILSLKLDIFIKNNPFDLEYIQIAFFLYLISSIISYFYVSDRILLSSDQKLYKINIIFNTSQILKFILEIFLLLRGTNIFVLITIYIILNFLSFNVLKLIVKKQYSWYNTKNVPANYEFKKDIKHLLPHKVMSTVAKNTDVLVISAFLGIVPTSIYGIYNYIMTFLNQVIGQIGSALFSIMGNYNAVESVENRKRIFSQYSFFTMSIANFLCIPLLFALNKFVVLWVGENMLVDTLTMTLFVGILYYNICTIPIGTFISVNGLFKDVKIAALIEMVLNVTLSIFFVNIFGIKGVLMATIISVLISSFIYSPYVLYKKVFKERSYSYYLKLLKNLSISIISYFVIFLILNRVNLLINSLLTWFIFGIIIFIINFVICFLLYFLLFKRDLVSVLKRFLRRRK